MEKNIILEETWAVCGYYNSMYTIYLKFGSNTCKNKATHLNITGILDDKERCIVLERGKQ